MKIATRHLGRQYYDRFAINYKVLALCPWLYCSSRNKWGCPYNIEILKTGMPFSCRPAVWNDASAASGHVLVYGENASVI